MLIDGLEMVVLNTDFWVKNDHKYICASRFLVINDHQ